jgi:Conserved hypothetical protein 2217 (DUF2460)
MTLPVYPSGDILRGLAFSQKWSPSFFNLPTATTATGADIDLGVAQHPLHDFELTYAVLRDGLFWSGRGAAATLEFRTMMGFHLQLGGTLGRFLFKNIDDCQVWRNQIGVGDGETTTFTLTRAFGAQGYFGTEPVGQVNLGEAFNVYLGGAAAPVIPTLYTVSTANPVANTITFASAPPIGSVIAVDMSYYYYCKLSHNSNTFEKFMHRLWMLSKVTLHSCRPGA